MNWIKYERGLWNNQPLPPERRMVLLLIEPESPHSACVVAGYLKYGAGEKDSPYFVHMGLGNRPSKIAYWCDCLPDEFDESIFPLIKLLDKNIE